MKITKSADKNLLPLIPASRAKQLPLSFTQQRLWFLHQLEPENVQYNIPVILRLEGQVDESLLRVALNKVIERHEVLRTTFVSVDEQPVQHIAENLSIPLTVTDLRSLLKANREKKAQTIIAAETHRRFDLSSGPLIRVGIIRLTSQVSLLWLVVHNSVADKSSLKILGREWNAYYRGIELPPLPIQYADFSVWQQRYLAENGIVLQQQLYYWQQRLSHAPALLELPTDKPRPALQSIAGDRVTFSLPPNMYERLNVLARQTNTTLFMILLAAFAVLLSRYSGQTDLVIGTPTANRQRKEIEGLIGFFVNTLALRLDLTGNPSFLELLQQVGQDTMEAYKHQDCLFEQLLDHLKIERSLSHTPLFQVMFILQNMESSALQLPDVKVTIEPLNHKTAKFDLTMRLTEDANTLSGEIEYCTALFERATIERFIKHWQTLLTGIIARPADRIAELPLLTGEERHTLLVEWNATEKEYPKDKTVTQLFEEQVARTPDNIAVVFEEAQLTYREINERANQLAHYLGALGVVPDTLVAICLPRSLELIVGLLGILKAGGAYVPLDPEYPVERLEYMLNDSKAPVLVMKNKEKTLPFDYPGKTVYLDSDWNKMAHEKKNNPSPNLHPDQPSYIIYTSGTTGKPKGIILPHRTLTNLISWEKTFLNKPMRVTQLAGVGFDVSLQEVTYTLLNGYELYVVPDSIKYSINKLVAFIKDNEINRLFLPTALLEVFADEVNQQLLILNNLQDITVAGEALKLTPAIKEFFSNHSQVALTNEYGPSETHVVTANKFALNETRGTFPFIGKPIFNTQLYVLDEHLIPVPIGVAGELFIGGVGLAQGYLNQPELTTERFITNPFANMADQENGYSRLYKTGDLVRWLPNGNLEYVGRNDFQVKLRGYRIELGEIETVLQKHPHIKETAVLMREAQSGEKHLVAYVIVKNEIEGAALRDHLKQQLPDYMLPSTFVMLEKFPLTPNGKLDRKALPAPEYVSEAKYVSPRNEIESRLATIWSKILKVEQVGVNDDFFALGGHSLLATQVVSHIRQTWQVDFPIRNIFQHPKLGVLADEITKQLQQLSDEEKSSYEFFPEVIANPAQRFEPFPLTDVQYAYWMGRSGIFALGSVSVHDYFEFDYPCSDLDIKRLEQAWNDLILRHEALRLIINLAGEQRILPTVPYYTFDVLDLTSESSAATKTKLQQIRKQLSHEVLPSEQWPIFKLRFTRFGKTIRMHVSFDALTLDAWSMVLLFAELRRLYHEPHLSLPALTLSFRDYVLSMKQLESMARYARDKTYWLERLATFPSAPALPLLKLPSQVKKLHFSRCTKTFSSQQWQKIKKEAQIHQLHPTALLAAIYAYVLAIWSTTAHFVLNITLFNRLPLHAQVNEVAGDFTSLLPLEVTLKTNETFATGAHRLQHQLWQDLDHTLYSGVSFQREFVHYQRQEGVPFPVVFTCILGNQQRLDLNVIDMGKVVYAISQTPQIWLDYQVYENKEGLVIAWDFVEELFPEGMIALMHATYCAVLERLSQEPAAWEECDRHWLPATERAIHAAVQATDWLVQYPLLQELFQRQADRQPQQSAVISARGNLTYGELQKRSNQLAHRLRALGAKPNQLVAVIMEKGWEQVVACLAILTAGAAYLPIDPKLPKERIEQLLVQGDAKVILTQTDYHPQLMALPLLQSRLLDKIIAVDEPAEFLNVSSDPLIAVQTLDDLAYVIFTSGSTGQPKGVMTDHRGVVNTILDINDRYQINTHDRVFALSNLNFDLSVYDVFGPLAAGGTIVMPAEKDVKEPAVWIEWLIQHEVTIWNSVPLFMQMLVEFITEHELKNLSRHKLRLILLSGDFIPLTLPGAIRKIFQPTKEPLQMISLGGATEASIWSIYYPIETVDPKWKSIPYGKPLRNQHFYVLNDRLSECPIGVEGDLYIAGIGLAKGYWRDTNKTQASFIQHPLTREKLYRTGDLGRYLPDGNIEFLGRRDFQVKVGGHRIELGEIEYHLQQQPGIHQVAVEAPLRQNNQRQLVAYLVLEKSVLDKRVIDEPMSGHETTQPAGVNNFSEQITVTLKKYLPDYMIPAAFVMLESFPLTPNGKLDRKALPAPEYANKANYIAPRNEIEKQLATIWSEVLKVEPIGMNDNFFALGGHSLLATQVAARIRHVWQVDFPLRTLFQHPTLGALAESFANLKPAENMLPVVSVSRAQLLPLSFAQQRLWFLHQLEPENVQYNIPVVLRLEGQVNEALLETALNKVIARHEVLRTTFVMVEDQPTQHIAADLFIPLVLSDLRKLPQANREKEAQTIIAAQTHHRFDLCNGPLIRAGIIWQTTHVSLLWLVVHHSVADGWSLSILGEEWSAYYRGMELPALPIQYADFTVWQRQYLADNGIVLQKQLHYWQQRLANPPALLELPIDKPRLAVQSTAGDRMTFNLPPNVYEHLSTLAQQTHTTLFMVLLTAFAMLLSRYSGQTDLVIGSPIANRQRKEIEGLIGFFANTLALRIDLTGNPSFLELLQRVRRDTLDAYEHQDCPFEQLVDHLKIERSLSHSPLFQVMFVLQNAEDTLLHLSTVKVTTEALNYKTAKFDLTMSLTEAPGKLIGEIEYCTALFERETIKRLILHWEILLAGIVARPADKLAELPLLTEKERHTLLVEWNATEKDYPKDKTVTQLFEEQVARTPDNIAVVFEETQLAYRALNERANQLAHYLRALGVIPDTLVAICLPRSFDMIIGLLGILKAGGAYVPLDPDYPADRLEYMLSDSNAPLLVMKNKEQVLPLAYAGRIVYLDSDKDKILNEKKDNLTSNTRPDQLAYVIYTSGSTGKPKGVLIEHQTIINTLFWAIETFELKEESRVLQFSSVNFDASVWEIFPSLLSGAAVVLAHREEIMPGENLHKTLSTKQITIASLPPVALSVTDATGLSELKVIVAGGDVCTKQIVEKWAAGKKFINAYGPTEISICATAGTVSEKDELITIGKPIANATCYLLNQSMQPVLIGAVGELYIGGAGLARGYLNRPELTAEKFIPNPFATKEDKEKSYTRLYKTGDLARWSPDGNLVYVGRNDFQVKIRGFRIELGEIEALLLKHPHIKEAVVLAREDQPGEKRLVAYVITKKEIDVSALRKLLKQHLPDYMIPAAFVVLEKFPLTPNGKLDRKALPIPEYAATAHYHAPHDALELALTQAWSKVLGKDTVGIQDNFFEIGGHSLLAVQLAHAISEVLNVEVPIASFFALPTIETMAEQIRRQDLALFNTPLVAIQPKGEKPAIFAIHPIGGNIMCYAELSKQLGNDQPFYGLQQIKSSSKQSDETLVQMAEEYVAAIQTVQPQGPYHLIGWSLGGVIAHEMAYQLEKQGETVSMLGLIDSYVPSSFTTIMPIDELDLLIYFARDLGGRYGIKLTLSKEELAALDAKQRLNYLLEKAKQAGAIASSENAKELEYLIQQYQRNGHAMAQHQLPIVQCPLVIFSADNESQEKESKNKQWAPYTRGTITVYEMTGDHYSLLSMPQVQLLAQQLQIYV